MADENTTAKNTLTEPRRERILVTGSTGYVGGRLVPRLLAAGYHVRCLVRDPAKLERRSWASDSRVHIVQGDAANLKTLQQAMVDCRVAYYMIHSMMVAGTTYRNRDQELAAIFAKAAEEAGIERIYLGGLGETGGGLSEHLASRREVEAALASGSVPVTVLRAAMIIGSGSASFEILRHLVERLPAMITPRWVNTECQPIAIADALYYLIKCLDTPQTSGQTIDIGGAEILNYRELMQQMAEVLELRRRVIIPVPVLTPRLSSLWIHFVTPVHRDIARPLAMGLRNRVVCRNDLAARLMPHQCLDVSQAMRAAVGKTSGDQIESSWTDAGTIPGDPDWAGGRTFEDRREHKVNASPRQLFRAVISIGGKRGWYAANPLWQLRGFLDRIAGGPGLSRGRRSEGHLAYGDVLDFWRVTKLVPDRILVLRAEMKLPGEAMLEFEIQRADSADRETTLIQTARFKPHGLAGIIYWYLVLPLHGIVFERMIRGMARAAEQSTKLEIQNG